MNIRKIVGLIILTTFAILATGCKEDELADWELLELRQMEILLIIGEPQCNNVVDCRYIAFGAKPCGGAWGYLIYSITTVDSLNLARRVAEYNRFNALLNERYGLSSDCSVPISPNLGCRSGRCVDLGYHPSGRIETSFLSGERILK